MRYRDLRDFVGQLEKQGELKRISAEKCRERARHLCQQRGLPRQRLATAVEYASPPCYAGEFPGYFGDDPDPKR